MELKEGRQAISLSKANWQVYFIGGKIGSPCLMGYFQIELADLTLFLFLVAIFSITLLKIESHICA